MNVKIPFVHIKSSPGSVIKVEKKYTALYDVVKVARDVASIIEEENAKRQRVIVNVSGGRKPRAFGALFGAYAGKEMVEQVVYVTEEDQFVLEFPLLGFGISKGMAYSHLRELKAMGYVSEGNGFKITSAGSIAII